MKTFSAKPSDIQKSWWVIDARNIVLGRLAAKVANILRGKNKRIFTPHMNTGDNVIIINAEHVSLSGKKMNKKNGKIYYRHSGFPGGIKETTASDMLSGRFPERVLKLAISRMLGKGPLAREQLRGLYIYKGEQHKHEAQNPTIYDFGKDNRKNIRV